MSPCSFPFSPGSFTAGPARWAALAAGAMLAYTALAAPPATETHVFKQVGPLAIKADVWRPTGPARPRPVLVCLHGGSLINGGREKYADSKLGEADAWRQVSGPPVANARDRRGDGSAFNDFIRRHAQWPKAISGWNPRTDAKKFLPYLPLRNVSPARQ